MSRTQLKKMWVNPHNGVSMNSFRVLIDSELTTIQAGVFVNLPSIREL